MNIQKVYAISDKSIYPNSLRNIPNTLFIKRLYNWQALSRHGINPLLDRAEASALTFLSPYTLNEPAKALWQRLPALPHVLDLICIRVTQRIDLAPILAFPAPQAAMLFLRRRSGHTQLRFRSCVFGVFPVRCSTHSLAALCGRLNKKPACGG